MRNINYKKDYSYISAANLQLIFGNRYLLLIFKTLSFLGAFSYILIFFPGDLYKLDVSVVLILKFIGFFGIISFVFYLFSALYFRWIENKEGLSFNPEEEQLYKIIDLELTRIISTFNLDNLSLSDFLNKIIKSPRVGFAYSEMNMSGDSLSIILSDSLKKDPKNTLADILEKAVDNALKEGENKITTADIFYGFIKQVSDISSFSSSLELEEEDIQSVIFWANRIFNEAKYPERMTEKLKNTAYGIGDDWAYGYTLFLDKYGVNINDPRFFDPAYTVGRKKNILALEEFLSKDQGSNCLIVGRPGVGKKTLVYALAGKLFTGQANSKIKHFRVVHLSVDRLMAGANNPEEVEDRILNVLKDAANSGNVILFIENIHILFQDSEKIGTIDATEVLLPYLSSGRIKIIGTTTDKEFHSYIEPKESLVSMFHKVELQPTDRQDTIKILEDVSLHYSSKYKVKVTFNGLKEIYRIANQFVSDMEFPRKAIDTLENALDCAARNNKKVLDSHAIDMVCQEILKVPIAQATSADKTVLVDLEKNMHKRVVSQKEAISAVANALKRKKAQVHDSKRPIGVFLFLGPTGVGKTEVAKTLADNYFGSEESIIRIDMNQLKGLSALEKLLGRKEAGKDQLEEGYLVKSVKEKPFSVILLDELEKASQDVLNLFLQIFDEGYAKDGMGNDISFSNTIIIATSNAKADMIRKGVGEGDWAAFKEKVIDSLQSEGIFTPEFVNRFDEVILFKPLTRENIRMIANIIIEDIKKDFNKKGYLIEVEDEVLDYLAEKGYQPEFGARPMRRAVQDTIENYLADKILKDEIKKGEAHKIKVSDIS